MAGRRFAGVEMQLALLVIAGCTPSQPLPPPTGLAPLAGNRGAPASHAGAEICGNHALLTGPSKPPKGAIIVPAGDNSSLTPALHTTYWFASGTHTFGSNPYGQIIAADGDAFIGGPNAVLDGRLKNQYAFTAPASNVTVEYLTIRRFGAVGSNNGQAVVNHNSGRNWSIHNNTVIDDAGAGVFLGPQSVTRYNCLSHNGEYGFASYKSHGDNDVILDHNEIVANNTYDWEKHVKGCGCSGGGKFWIRTAERLPTIGFTITVVPRSGPIPTTTTSTSQETISRKIPVKVSSWKSLTTRGSRTTHSFVTRWSTAQRIQGSQPVLSIYRKAAAIPAYLRVTAR